MAGNVPQWSYTTTLPATSTSPREARAFVVQHLIAHRLQHLAESVRLVASELATNALVHAHTAFSVTLAADDDTVVLTVRDESASLPVPRVARVMDADGRGLGIVDLVSSDWGVTEERSGVKAVWASFATT